MIKHEELRPAHNSSVAELLSVSESVADGSVMMGASHPSLENVRFHKMVEDSLGTPHRVMQFAKDGQILVAYLRGDRIVRGMGKYGRLVMPSQVQAYRDAVENSPPAIQDPPSHEGPLVEEGDFEGLTMNTGKILVVNHSANLRLDELQEFTVRAGEDVDGRPLRGLMVDSSIQKALRKNVVPDLAKLFGVKVSSQLEQSRKIEKKQYFYQICTADNYLSTVLGLIGAGDAITRRVNEEVRVKRWTR